jgi:glycosyltransferase involved in cell wall biosynthesis
MNREDKLKILCDHLCFQERYGGVSKYFIQMICNLPKEIQYQISVKYTNNEYIKELPNIATRRIFDNVSFKGKNWLISIINKPNSIRTLKQGDYDIYHQTHYDPYGYRYIAKNKKSIMTVYDMNFFTVPHVYNKGYAFKTMCKWQKLSAQSTDKIIAISENTKKDIMEIWGIQEHKIDVIYLGIEKIDLATYNKKRLYNRPYILFVGVRTYHKNFDNYLQTFRIIAETNNDLLLVCSGNPFSANEKKQIYELNLTDKVLQISASEDMMVNLYYNAEVFVYPSYYEGFGMPLLEAMNCNCPVICSDTSCFGEVAQDAALYFDPYSIESMTETTKQILNDKEMRLRLIQNGAKRKEYFSWEKCAKEHARVYNSLLN